MILCKINNITVQTFVRIGDFTELHDVFDTNYQSCLLSWQSFRAFYISELIRILRVSTTTSHRQYFVFAPKTQTNADCTKKSRQHKHQTHEYRERVRKRRVQHSTTLNNDATERENSWLVKTADNVRANCERESEVRLGVMFGSCNEQWVDATRCRPPLSPQSKVLQRTPRRRTTQRTHKLQALHSRHSPRTQ